MRRVRATATTHQSAPAPDPQLTGPLDDGTVTWAMMEPWIPLDMRAVEEGLQAEVLALGCWTNSRHIAGDLRSGVQKLKDATPACVPLGSGKLSTELDRLDLIDEYKFLVHPRIAGHGPTLHEGGLPTRDGSILSQRHHYASARSRSPTGARETNSLMQETVCEASGHSDRARQRFGNIA